MRGKGVGGNNREGGSARGSTWWWAGPFLLLLLAIHACGEGTAPPPTPSPQPAERWTVATVPAGTVQLERWSAAYRRDRPDVALEIESLPPGQAQEALARGAVELALLDQEPAPSYQGVLTATRVASQSIAIVVHLDNPLIDLSSAAVSELFSGRVADWSQVGGAAWPVQVYLPPGSAGEVQAFTIQAMAGRRLAPTALVRASAASVCTAVATDPGGIGLVPIDAVEAEVAILRVDGHLPQEAGYPWHLPLYLAYGPASPRRVQGLIHFVWRKNK